MVVLSASVCTRQGKALVSRQFVEMNRLRVEGLLAAFPKLMGNYSHFSQHTYVETDTVRYVYQPLENQMYLLLITTKASNIVEDLGTLRLLAKVVPDIAGGFMEHSIHEHAFDLIFAFDEVLTAGGYKEEVNLSSIRTNLLMDSHEEKIANALEKSKQEQAEKIMRDQVKKINERNMAGLRQNFVTGGGGAGAGVLGGMEGFGGGGRPESTSIFDLNGQMMDQQNPNNKFGGNDNVYAQTFQQPQSSAPEAPKVLAKSGMKLGAGGGGPVGGGGGGRLGMGGGKNKDSLMAAMAAEDNLFPMAAGGNKAGGNANNAFGDLMAPAPAAAPAVPSTPLTLVLEEKIGVSMNREGAIETCEVKGTLTLTANTDAGASALVAVTNNNGGDKNFTFQTHPKVDKKMYEKDNVLSLKGGKDFPVGKNVGILRWSYNGEDAAPLTINCWPEEEGSGRINVNIEMEFVGNDDVVLYDVNILLPLGTTDAPEVSEIDGIYKHDANNGMMCWHMDQVDKGTNSAASLEFNIAGMDTDAFFPIQIGFRSETLLCPIQIANVTSSGTNAPIPHQMTKSFTPENYQCA